MPLRTAIAEVVLIFPVAIANGKNFNVESKLLFFGKETSFFKGTLLEYSYVYSSYFFGC